MCTATSQATTIANVGANILANGKITASDYNELLTYTVGEYSRRGLTPTYNAYAVTPNTDGAVLLEHVSKWFTDLNNFPGSGTSYAMTQYNVVKTADMSDAITYLKSLMNQNIVA
jgi:hypothetical protein